MASWVDRTFGAREHTNPVFESVVVASAQRRQDEGYVPLAVLRYEWRTNPGHVFLGVSMPTEVLVEIDFEPGPTTRTFADWWAEHKIPLTEMANACPEQPTPRTLRPSPGAR